MKIEVFMNNKKGLYNAKGVYNGGEITILKGSTIKTKQESKFKRAKLVAALRDDPNYVGKDMITKQDILCKSPSTAAQFVTDSSTNGYESWKTSEGLTLKHYLETNKEK